MTLLTLLLIAAPADASSNLPWIGPSQPAGVVPSQPAGDVEVVRYDTPATPISNAPGLFDQPPATALPTTASPPAAAAGVTASSVSEQAASAKSATGQPAIAADVLTFPQRLTSLNLALSATVIDEPTRWSFDRLQAEARNLATLASTQAERADVLALQSRLDRFASIAERLQQARTNADGWRRPSEASLATDSRLAPPVRLTKTAPTSRHDAEGILRPVVSKRPNAPKYAVINADGKIAALITPTAETEKQLKEMLGKRVGLNGQRGYLTDLRREHVVAERVTPLGTIRR